jgi:two-component system, OmpR family, copper resistance phosphate regulon response regulator CusR
MHRILIAEDEFRLAAFVAKGLRKNGFDVEIAEDGEQASALLEKENFALLLLDIGLPLKDGWSVLKEVRYRDRKLPVIIVTALADERHRDRALASGADDYLAKPFKFSDLLEKCKLLLAEIA